MDSLLASFFAWLDCLDLSLLVWQQKTNCYHSERHQQQYIRWLHQQTMAWVTFTSLLRYVAANCEQCWWNDRECTALLIFRPLASGLAPMYRTDLLDRYVPLHCYACFRALAISIFTEPSTLIRPSPPNIFLAKYNRLWLTFRQTEWKPSSKAVKTFAEKGCANRWVVKRIINSVLLFPVG